MRKWRTWIILSSIFVILTGLYYYFITKSEVNIILQSSVQTFKILKNSTFIGIGVSAFLAVIGGNFAVKEIKNKNNKVLQYETEVKERKSDPAKQILYEIDEYLKSDETIEQIKNGLFTISKSFPAVKRQYDNVNLLVGNRFDSDSLSYKKFMAPVENLFQTMTRAVSDLIQKLKLFDEAECLRKIEKYTNNGDANGAKQQEDILSNYIKYVTDIIKSIDEISLRFDMLILEVGKLSDEELSKSFTMLGELDNVIAHTKLYQD